MSNHLNALLRKQYILWKRSPCCSICEILLPVILSAFLFIFRASIDKTDMAPMTYLTDNQVTFNLYEPSNTASNQIDKMDYFVNCMNRTNRRRSGQRERNGHIALAPNNNFTQQLALTFTNVYGYDHDMYNSQDEIDAHITAENYADDICVSIVFLESTNNKFTYQIGYNTSGQKETDTDDVPDPLDERTVSYQTEEIKYHYDLWKSSGFVRIQNWIDNLILQSASSATDKIQVQISHVKTPAYVKDELASTLKGNFAPYVVLPLIIIFLRMTYGLLIEKEKKIKEGMKIMGMNDSSFYLSWIIWYFVIYFITSLLVSLILKGTVFANSNFLLILICHQLFCYSLIAQSLFIQVFFSRAKIGNIIAMVWFLAMYLSTFFINSGDISTESRRAGSISSHAGITFACDAFLLVETNGHGVTFDNASELVAKYSVGIYIYMCIINILVFVILGLYLDQVFPNEFGHKKHPLFFILWMFPKKHDQAHNEQLIADHEKGDHQVKNDRVEDVDSNLRKLEQEGNCLKVEGLSKIYPSGKKAVSNLSMNMYQDQIFVLLGHNGAGKTSTISMLTGMQNFTQGEATVYGKNVKTQIDDIRKFMGVCPQHDILYADLTVREHLEMFAVFKGMDDKLIPEAVQKAIEDVDLQEKADDLSKNLSGGQKRRLSVAIAFIGDSKLIYLDEPTSGMDTSARRHIWEMLKKYKNDKIIVLTTHFMDEADFLGDRIAIMGGGKLICLGSSVFLKNQFGVGYNLTVVKTDTVSKSENIIDLVKKYIPECNILSQESAEVSFQLPMSFLKNFPALFEDLDQQKNALGIQSYGISITTMEEVFLKVAHLDPDKIQGKKLNELAANQALEEVQHHHEEPNDQIDDFDLNSVRITGTFQVFALHFWALLLKRVRYFKRDLQGFICEVFLPCAVVVGGLAILTVSFITESKPVPISPLEYSEYLPFATTMAYDSSITSTTVDSLKQQFKSDYWKLTVPSASSTPEEWDNSVFSQWAPSLLGSYRVTEYNIGGPKSFKYTTEVNSQHQMAMPILLNSMNQAIVRQINPAIEINVINRPLRFTEKFKGLEGATDGIIGGFIFSIALAFIPASIITFTVKEREDQVKHQQMVCGVSISAYWISNLFMDYLKHLVPAAFSILMALAFDIDSFTGEADSFGALALLFIFYGWSAINFSYLTGFLFKSYGNAQVATFFIHFIMGGILPLIFFILKIIESTKDAATAIAWILRLFPSFAFGFGVVSIGSKVTINQAFNNKAVPNSLSTDVAGGDIIFLVWTGCFYFLMVFVIEKLQNTGKLNKMFNNEDAIQFKEKVYDDDVQKEIETVANTSPKDYTVRVNNLRKVFMMEDKRHKVAVDRVSFGIKNGEVFTLLGVNGAGKTTTFKILSGEIQQTSGDVHIAGYDLRTDIVQARRNIGYCPQFDALLDNLTTREHLELYADIKGIPKERKTQLIDKKIKEMNLTDFEHIPAGTYSGGNKRKLSVAIAMLGNPSIVFLDEPSTGMDPQARRFMWNVISRIATKRKQSSIILTTHSMEEAEYLSTRIAIQVEGVIKCLGSVQHIKNKFGKGYEIEIKTTLPTKEQLQQRINKTGYKLDTLVKNTEIEQVLSTLNLQHLKQHLTEDGYGSAIYLQLQRQGVFVEQLVEFAMIEEYGQHIIEFIDKNLGQHQIIEHFNSFYRFQIEVKISIGKVFNLFEQNKQQLNISQYSVKQASIEQIFNNFAIGKIQINNNLTQSQQQLQLQNQPSSNRPTLQPIKLAQKQKQVPLEDENKESGIEMQQQQINSRPNSGNANGPATKKY